MPILGTVASQFSGKSFSSFESISTVTVGSGGSSSISFTSIPSTYTHLQIRAVVKSTYSGNGTVNGYFNLNSDSSDSNYSSHNFNGNGASVSASGNANYRTMAFWASCADDGFCANIIDILDYANTNKFKTVRTLAGRDGNGSGTILLSSVGWRNTAAITSITAAFETNLAQYSQFALYGIKGS